MKRHVSQYVVIVALILIFLLPGVAAYIFYQHPQWLGRTKINKGTLLTPAVHFRFNVPSAPSKWVILFWSPSPCALTCQKQLDSLARVRLALGRKWYQVEEWLILGPDVPALSPDLLASLRNQQIHLMQLSMDQSSSFPRNAAVFLADSRHYLILRYAAKTRPDPVYQDLKWLLNISEQQGGRSHAP